MEVTIGLAVKFILSAFLCKVGSSMWPPVVRLHIFVTYLADFFIPAKSTRLIIYSL